MCVCVCVCVVHRQTVSLYHNSSVWLDTQDASSWDRNLPNFTLDLVSYRSTIVTTYVSSGIIMHFVLSLVCLYLTLSDTGVLNSLAEHSSLSANLTIIKIELI